MRLPELAGIRAEAGALLVVWLVFVLVGIPLLILVLHQASGVVFPIGKPEGRRQQGAHQDHLQGGIGQE